MSNTERTPASVVSRMDGAASCQGTLRFLTSSVTTAISAPEMKSGTTCCFLAWGKFAGLSGSLSSSDSAASSISKDSTCAARSGLLMSVRSRSNNGRMIEELKGISLKRRGWVMVRSLLATRETVYSVESSSKQSRIINITSTGRLFEFVIAGFINIPMTNIS